MVSPRATTCPSGPITSTGSPSAKVPRTSVIPAGSSDLPRSVSAVTAPASTTSAPREVVACCSHQVREARRRPDGRKTVPTSSPASTPATSPAAASTAVIPAAPAIEAASTFVCIPPVPTREPRALTSTAASSSAPRTTGIRRAPGRSGLSVYSASTSVSSTSVSAPMRCATSAASRSLSPNRISLVATVSFSLITGTMPSASSRSRVRRALV